MLQHAHLTLGFVYELGFHNFAKAVEGEGEL